MTFTPTPPTAPGFYAWRNNEEEPIKLCEARKDEAGIAIDCDGYYVGSPDEIGGLWCRLVPAEELASLADSVEAFMQSADSAGVKIPFIPCEPLMWTMKECVNRARRVAEGEEG